VNVLIVGGHGKIALRLARILAERGDTPRGVIRNPEQAADLEEIGAEPVVLDVENEPADALAEHVRGSDAVVFAAGAGPGSGSERKRTVDYGAAVKLIEACEGTGVERYLMVSAMGVERESYPGRMRPYYEAKRDADDALRASSLAYTIVRPGALTDDPGTGLIAAGLPIEGGGSNVPREDVAATLAAALAEPLTAGLTFDLLSGDTPIDEAVAGLVR
jgi:uncharacterized protein YbjT (DUF2867 family)